MQDTLSPPVTLEQVIEIALENSLALDEARVERAKGVQSLAEGVGGLLPRITASSSTSDSALADLGEGMWGTQLSLSQPVVDAATLFGLIGGFQQHGISRAQSRQTLAKLILDTHKAYYSLAASQAFMESAQRQYTRARENLRISEKRYELGSANKADKLRAEASVLSAERELVSARTNLANNQRILADLAGIEDWKTLKTHDIPDATKPDSLITTLTTSTLIADNPDYDLLRRQAKSTDLAYWGSWASLLPSLSLTASKNFSQDGVLPDLSNWEEVSPNYGLSLSFPIADLKGKALSVNRARLDRKQSRIDLAQQELYFRQQLANLLAIQESSYKGWEYASKNVELSEEVYRLSARSYELGASSLADLLQVEAELVSAERALVQATTDYWSARAELNYFLGNPSLDLISQEDR